MAKEKDSKSLKLEETDSLISGRIRRASLTANKPEKYFTFVFFRAVCCFHLCVKGKRGFDMFLPLCLSEPFSGRKSQCTVKDP